MSLIKVVLVDDHQLVREALAELLTHEDDMDVVGTAASAEQSLALVGERLPDVVLMDVAMPGTDGITATRELRRTHPSLRVLMLTSSRTSSLVEESFAAGACDYLLKGDPIDRLLAGIRTAARCRHCDAASTTRPRGCTGPQPLRKEPGATSP